MRITLFDHGAGNLHSLAKALSGEGRTDPAFAASGLVTAYYANRYACRPDDPSAVSAWSTHEGDRYAAAVRRGACVGVQFHPEKSSRPGLRFLDHLLHGVTETPARQTLTLPDR